MTITHLDLYVDPESGKPISTHSMLKTFRRCPKQAEYKYVERLKPKTLGKPLKRGTWIHKLLEVKYQAIKDGAGQKESEEAWRAEHARLSAKFEKLFDDERDYYGDLPEEILLVMEAYEWHYGQDSWIIHEIEFLIEVDLPDGSIYRGKVDLLIEDQFGLWIVDHKSHASLPKLEYRILDSQSADYVWAALKAKIPIQGHIWNYIRWKAPSIPKLAYLGKPTQRLSKSACDTDYPTFVKTLRQYKEDYFYQITDDDLAKAKWLKSLRYEHGAPQNSTFFRRDVLERSPGMLSRVAREMYHTHKRMHGYPWHKPEAVERVPDRSCGTMCNYSDICAVELWGGDARQLRRSRYRVGDPMDYYYDEKEVAENEKAK